MSSYVVVNPDPVLLSGNNSPSFNTYVYNSFGGISVSGESLTISQNYNYVSFPDSSSLSGDSLVFDSFDPSVRVSQQAVLVAGNVEDVNLRVSQMAVEVMGSWDAPARVSQFVINVLVDGNIGIFSYVMVVGTEVEIGGSAVVSFVYNYVGTPGTEPTIESSNFLMVNYNYIGVPGNSFSISPSSPTIVTVVYGPSTINFFYTTSGGIVLSGSIISRLRIGCSSGQFRCFGCFAGSRAPFQPATITNQARRGQACFKRTTYSLTSNTGLTRQLSGRGGSIRGSTAIVPAFVLCQNKQMPRESPCDKPIPPLLEEE